MTKYPKIQSIFKRNPDDNYKTFLEGQYSTEWLEYLANNIWYWTEKINGTNIRILWHSHPLMVSHIVFKGRTDKAQIPIFLLAKLNKIFIEDKMLKVFKIGESDDIPDVCMYGEGYGAKIQKSGGKYIPKGVDFILFDIKIGDWWLKRNDVEEIASKLDLKVVPIIGKGTLDDAIKLIKSGTLKSQWGDFLAEGMVLKPMVELKARNGNRVITKIKHKDYGIAELIELSKSQMKRLKIQKGF